MLVLVTGATGMLGRALLSPAIGAGLRLRLASRSVAAGTLESAAAERVELDLANGRGLDEALEGVDAVVHAASSPRGRSREVDVRGTHLLVDAARRHGVAHLVYPSIIGIDRIEWPYYRHKLEAERAIRESGVPYSIVRGTQFHVFVAEVLRMAHRLPVALVPRGVLLQSVDEAEYAAALLELLAAGPSGAVEEVAGPEVLRVEAMAAAWRRASGVRRPLLHVRVPGSLVRGLRAGGATSAQARCGTITWQAWLDGRVAAGGSRARSGRGNLEMEG